MDVTTVNGKKRPWNLKRTKKYMQEVLEGGKGLYKLCNYVIISTIKVKRGDEFIPSIVPMVSQTNFLLSREKKIKVSLCQPSRDISGSLFNRKGILMYTFIHWLVRGNWSPELTSPWRELLCLVKTQLLTTLQKTTSTFWTCNSWSWISECFTFDLLIVISLGSDRGVNAAFKVKGDVFLSRCFPFMRT